MNYIEFLRSKQQTVMPSGFDVNPEQLCRLAFDWQRDITRWALKKGKCALFEDCGLGKTIQQLMWADAVSNHTGRPVLIIAPLAVAAQTRREGLKFGFEVTICRGQQDIKPGINITNYEMLEHFDAAVFSGVVLDESSILKDYTSSTKQRLIEMFADTPYKLCCTATPSPNDFTEIGNHAEFLGVMSRSEMLATFFVHDGGDTSKWRLKGHAESKFFEWVASWACCLTNPADIGYDGTGYDLPPLRIIEHVVRSGSLDDDGQMMLDAKTTQTLSERRAARRDSLAERVSVAAELANAADGQCLVWCDLNAESEQLTAAINGAVEVKGADKPEHKTAAMNGFTDGNVRALVSKPSIAGWGMNWQNCGEMIFVGLSDSFEAYYQAVRRCWRYGRKDPVTVHIVISDAEGTVKTNIERKQADARRMTSEIVKYTKEILTAEIHNTARITENYIVSERMEVPRWLRSGAA